MLVLLICSRGSSLHRGRRKEQQRRERQQDRAAPDVPVERRPWERAKGSSEPEGSAVLTLRSPGRAWAAAPTSAAVPTMKSDALVASWTGCPRM
jgi:hypothetical protein